MLSLSLAWVCVCVCVCLWPVPADSRCFPHNITQQLMYPQHSHTEGNVCTTAWCLHCITTVSVIEDCIFLGYFWFSIWKKRINQKILNPKHRVIKCVCVWNLLWIAVYCIVADLYASFFFGMVNCIKSPESERYTPLTFCQVQVRTSHREPSKTVVLRKHLPVPGFWAVWVACVSGLG